MTILPIRQSWDSILHTPSRKIEDFTDPTLGNIMTDLTETMHEGGLIGIAAPQIGYAVRIIVTEIRETPSRKWVDTSPLQVYINPEIIWKSEELSGIYEGCGSVDNAWKFAIVERPDQIKVRAQDIKGDIFELEASGLLSHVIQHEIDHILGILFTKHVDPGTIITAEEYRAIKK